VDIRVELDRCHDQAGRPLDGPTRQLLEALVANPSPEGWAAATDLTVGVDGRTSLVDACAQVDTLVPQLTNPRAAIIVAGLRRAAGTEGYHADRARRVGVWPSLRAYYADDPVREGSPETDSGVGWTFGGPATWPPWRVSWVAYTGEVYAYAQAHPPHERVVLVAARQTKAEAEAALDGWADPERTVHQLAWVFRRFGWTRLPEAVWPSYQPLSP
jgi:hypothetical protein